MPSGIVESLWLSGFRLEDVAADFSGGKMGVFKEGISMHVGYGCFDVGLSPQRRTILYHETCWICLIFQNNVCLFVLEHFEQTK